MAVTVLLDGKIIRVNRPGGLVKNQASGASRRPPAGSVASASSSRPRVELDTGMPATPQAIRNYEYKHREEIEEERNTMYKTDVVNVGGTEYVVKYKFKRGYVIKHCPRTNGGVPVPRWEYAGYKVIGPLNETTADRLRRQKAEEWYQEALEYQKTHDTSFEVAAWHVAMKHYGDVKDANDYRNVENLMRMLEAMHHGENVRKLIAPKVGGIFSKVDTWRSETNIIRGMGGKIPACQANNFENPFTDQLTEAVKNAKIEHINIPDYQGRSPADSFVTAFLGEATWGLSTFLTGDPLQATHAVQAATAKPLQDTPLLAAYQLYHAANPFPTPDPQAFAAALAVINPETREQSIRNVTELVREHPYIKQNVYAEVAGYTLGTAAGWFITPRAVSWAGGKIAGRLADSDFAAFLRERLGGRLSSIAETLGEGRARLRALLSTLRPGGEPAAPEPAAPPGAYAIFRGEPLTAEELAAELWKRGYRPEGMPLEAGEAKAWTIGDTRLKRAWKIKTTPTGIQAWWVGEAELPGGEAARLEPESPFPFRGPGGEGEAGELAPSLSFPEGARPSQPGRGLRGGEEPGPGGRGGREKLLLTADGKVVEVPEEEAELKIDERQREIAENIRKALEIWKMEKAGVREAEAPCAGTVTASRILGLSLKTGAVKTSIVKTMQPLQTREKEATVGAVALQKPRLSGLLKTIQNTEIRKHIDIFSRTAQGIQELQRISDIARIGEATRTIDKIKTKINGWTDEPPPPPPPSSRHFPPPPPPGGGGGGDYLSPPRRYRRARYWGEIWFAAPLGPSPASKKKKRGRRRKRR